MFPKKPVDSEKNEKIQDLNEERLEKKHVKGERKESRELRGRDQDASSLRKN